MLERYHTSSDDLLRTLGFEVDDFLDERFYAEILRAAPVSRAAGIPNT
jgi:hypothetical protein